MAATLEELEKRVACLEREVTRLRQLIEPGAITETPAERGARMLREADASEGQFAAGWDKAMNDMGIHGQPIGAEKLQEMIAACGVKPEDNEFSREIIKMREE